MSAAAVGGFNAKDPAANGWRMPSTAEDVLADIHRAEAAVGERRKRLDLASFMLCILRSERAATNRHKGLTNIDLPAGTKSRMRTVREPLRDFLTRAGLSSKAYNATDTLAAHFKSGADDGNCHRQDKSHRRSRPPRGL